MTLVLCSGVCLCLYLCSPCNVVGYGHSLCYSLSRVVCGLPVPGDRRWQGHAKWLLWVVADVREESWSQQDRWCEEPFPWMGLHSYSSLTAIPSLFPPRPLWPPWDPASCCSPGLLLTVGKMSSKREWLTVDHDNSKHSYSNSSYLFVQRYKAGKEVKCLKGCSFNSSLKYVVFLMKCGRIWQPQTDPTISRSHRLCCESSSLAT